MVSLYFNELTTLNELTTQRKMTAHQVVIKLEFAKQFKELIVNNIFLENWATFDHSIITIWWCKIWKSQKINSPFIFYGGIEGHIITAITYLFMCLLLELWCWNNFHLSMLIWELLKTLLKINLIPLAYLEHQFYCRDHKSFKISFLIKFIGHIIREIRDDFGPEI